MKRNALWDSIWASSGLKLNKQTWCRMACEVFQETHCRGSSLNSGIKFESWSLQKFECIIKTIAHWHFSIIFFFVSQLKDIIYGTTLILIVDINKFRDNMDGFVQILIDSTLQLNISRTHGWKKMIFAGKQSLLSWDKVCSCFWYKWIVSEKLIKTYSGIISCEFWLLCLGMQG